MNYLLTLTREEARHYSPVTEMACPLQWVAARRFAAPYSFVRDRRSSFKFPEDGLFKRKYKSINHHLMKITNRRSCTLPLITHIKTPKCPIFIHWQKRRWMHSGHKTSLSTPGELSIACTAGKDNKRINYIIIQTERTEKNSKKKNYVQACRTQLVWKQCSWLSTIVKMKCEQEEVPFLPIICRQIPLDAEKVIRDREYK